MAKEMSKDERAAYMREYRASKRAEKELDQQRKADEREAFVMALTGNRVEIEMDDVEAVAAILDVHEQARAENALSDYMSKRYVKNRTWACIIYPDSAPTDWEDKLRLRGVIAAVSPLHDLDKTKDGLPKKPHYHVIMDWPGGSVTFRTVAALSKGLLNGTLPIPLTNPRGYYRYFTHLDDPQKAQYDKSLIVHINGFDIGSFLELTKAEKIQLRKEVDILIEELDITEYRDLMTYVRIHKSDDMYDLVSTSTMYFTNVLRSRRNAPAKYNYKNGNELVWDRSEDGSYSFVGEINSDTGEIMKNV